MQEKNSDIYIFLLICEMYKLYQQVSDIIITKI